MREPLWRDWSTAEVGDGGIPGNAGPVMGGSMGAGASAAGAPPVTGGGRVAAPVGTEAAAAPGAVIGTVLGAGEEAAGAMSAGAEEEAGDGEAAGSCATADAAVKMTPAEQRMRESFLRISGPWWV